MEANDSIGNASMKHVTTNDAGSSSKPSLTMVVIGHVNAGKSTLVGNLLYFSQEKNISENRGSGKSKITLKSSQNSIQQNVRESNTKFAWMLDEQAMERERGITMEYHVKHLELQTLHLTLIDSPGHSELTSDALAGAMLADFALLVVDASDFESDVTIKAQTKEHSIVVRAIGISRIIVVFNKLDCFSWNEQKYMEAVRIILAFLTGPELRFKSSDIICIPVSALRSVNIRPSDICCEALSWWKGASLCETIESTLQDLLDNEKSDEFFKACVPDVWTTNKGEAAAVKLASGCLQTGEKVLLLPSRVSAICRSITINEELQQECRDGQYVDRMILSCQSGEIFRGSVLCTIAHPLPCSTEIFVKIMVFKVDIPLVQGQNFMLFLHTNVQAVSIKRIVTLIAKQSKQNGSLKTPKHLTTGNVAIVELSCPNKLCYEYKTFRKSSILSRLMLRRSDRTVAAGFVINPQQVE
ncbi:elongation factor Tu GTP binding domain-containing protein [Cardiosporidium cionae]|uniref:Elongation factor Tu GTP binding domain-containing protein n=1 Tax=Cardiosporidium cionae TaxID=476202 RepID=A0ABQ7J8S5_9APIC|nr:elongation factor Tu GTP binding domain-containing protein [Cardiosporidium cionae]|eukprot:KAF8820369.1 elongation factor Tu GTP binding domain-containing protein [Cardiosporidium cionae]